MDRQKATGIAAGLTLATVGGISAIVLTSGPSIAAAFNGDSPAPAATVEVDPIADPTVVVVDENGNVITSDGATDGTSTDSYGSDTGQAATYDEEYEEDDYEDDDYDEEDEYEDEDEHEEDEDEDEDEHEEEHAEGGAYANG